MKVYIIAQDAGSKELGMLYRNYFIGQGLKKRGHEVEMVAGSFSHVRRKNPIVIQELETQIVEGIPYHWIKTLHYSGNSIRRALGIFLFSIKLWFFANYFARKFEADAVIASSPHPLIVWGAHRLAKKLSQKRPCKFIFEVRDIWPLSMHELSGMKKNHPFYILCQWAEDYAYKHADTVVSLLPYAYEHMQTRGLKKEKFVYIPNGFDQSEWDKRQHLNADASMQIYLFKKKYSFLIGYAGAHSVVYSLDQLLEAFSILQKNKNTQAGLVLVGDGPDKAMLLAKARDLKLDNVLFVDMIAKNEVPSLLEKMDVAYISLKKTPLFKYGISPNKLIDYMAAGKPVLYAVDTQRDPVQESGCGIHVDPHNPKQIAQAVQNFAAMTSDDLKAMGAKGNKWTLKNLAYENLIKKYEEILS